MNLTYSKEYAYNKYIATRAIQNKEIEKWKTKDH
jgi:hypothetical protein